VLSIFLLPIPTITVPPKDIANYVAIPALVFSMLSLGLFVVLWLAIDQWTINDHLEIREPSVVI
jgi:hypothetical protein